MFCVCNSMQNNLTGIFIQLARVPGVKNIRKQLPRKIIQKYLKINYTPNKAKQTEKKTFLQKRLCKGDGLADAIIKRLLLLVDYEGNYEQLLMIFTSNLMAELDLRDKFSPMNFYKCIYNGSLAAVEMTT